MQVVCATLDCTVDKAGVDPALLQEQVKCHHLVHYYRHSFQGVWCHNATCSTMHKQLFFTHRQIARVFGGE